jgi:hypothetical protein
VVSKIGSSLKGTIQIFELFIGILSSGTSGKGGARNLKFLVRVPVRTPDILGA